MLAGVVDETGHVIAQQTEPGKFAVANMTWTRDNRSGEGWDTRVLGREEGASGACECRARSGG